MSKNKLFNNDEDVVLDYESGISVEKIATKHHIGKIRVKNILTNNGVVLLKKNFRNNFIVNDWKIKKFKEEEGFCYKAICKKYGVAFNDYMNSGGYLTTYIKKTFNIVTPTLFERRKHYMTTGNYWWEQWFDIVKFIKKETKKCPFCDWKTEDVTNKSGAFENHLLKTHDLSKYNYVKSHPEEKHYFQLANKTLNLEFENNKNKYIICKICGRKLARISNSHLKTHGITKNEYIKKIWG